MKTTVREPNEWVTLRWHDEQETAHLPRILVVGDSIAAGHGTRLSQRLKGVYGVDCFATSKIVCDHEFMTDLEIMLSRHRYDIIIFNNGLHGVAVDDALYAAGLHEVLLALQSRTDHLVWRNSTPCYPGADGKANPQTEHVQIRNRLAEAEIEKLGIPMIDCYAALANRPELVCDGVHFYPEGYHIIVDTICDYLKDQRSLAADG